MDKSRIKHIRNQFFCIDLDTDNLKFIHSGCWNTECKNRINHSKLEKLPYINTALYDQLHITTKINTEDVSFLSLIGDNIYQKYYEANNADPPSILYKIPNGIQCINQCILLGLGNHDTSDKVTYDRVMQLNDEPKIFIPCDYYCLIIKMREFSIKLIYINTNILNVHEHSEPYYRYNKSKVEYLQMQVDQYEFLDEAINNPEFETTYTFVLGHEPIIHAPHSKELCEETDRVQLLRINELINRNNNVDFYLNADEHNLQSISSKMSKLKYIISGGGGALGDFPVGLYNKKLENIDFILQTDKYRFNNVIASHGYVRFEINKDSVQYHFVVPDYVSNNLDNTIDRFDDSIFSAPFKIISTDVSTALYISPKCSMLKEGGRYYQKYLKYKQKYLVLKQLDAFVQAEGSSKNILF